MREEGLRSRHPSRLYFDKLKLQGFNWLSNGRDNWIRMQLYLYASNLRVPVGDQSWLYPARRSVTVLMAQTKKLKCSKCGEKEEVDVNFQHTLYCKACGGLMVDQDR